jgi:hypothetical protein
MFINLIYLTYISNKLLDNIIFKYTHTHIEQIMSIVNDSFTGSHMQLMLVNTTFR